MKHRWDNLSAFHRLTTAIAIKAGLDERVRLNEMEALIIWYNVHIVS